MSQHQQAFLVENTSEVARVARQVLTMLTSGDAGELNAQAGAKPTSTETSSSALAEQLYITSYSSDPAQFASVLSEAQAGCSDDILAFDLIPNIARRLGASWEDDLISFADVTIACARLQSALRRMPDDIEKHPLAHNGMQRECLVMLPSGAQHTLGALVLAKQLRQAQQRVTLELAANESVLTSLARKQKFNAVLISASQSECPQGLRQMIALIRKHWAASKIVVGGSVCELGSELRNVLGADHVTSDWREALDL